MIVEVQAHWLVVPTCAQVWPKLGQTPPHTGPVVTSQGVKHWQLLVDGLMPHACPWGQAPPQTPVSGPEVHSENWHLHSGVPGVCVQLCPGGHGPPHVPERGSTVGPH